MRNNVVDVCRLPDSVATDDVGAERGDGQALRRAFAAIELRTAAPGDEVAGLAFGQQADCGI